MYAVEIALSDKDKLGDTIEAMRTWLDRKRFEPAAFRYSLACSARVLFHLDFAVDAEATAFADAFGGKVIA
jgi:hypothetical protein